MVGKKLAAFLSKREMDPLSYYADVSHDGIAPIDDPKDLFDQKTEEQSVAYDWIKSCRELNICIVNDLRFGDDPNSAPDFWAEIDGKVRRIELTKLIDGRFRAAQKKAYAQGRNLNAFSSDGFAKAQWTEDRFFKCLSACIQKKSVLYSKPTSNISHVDILVVYTTEKWLLPDKVEKWLSELSFKQYDNIASVHLLLEYDPHWKLWPTFKVY